MKRSILYLCGWLCLACASCSKEELPDPLGVTPASLKLSVCSSQNGVKTRAVSSDAEENLIRNLYIFVFNPDGSVDYRGYFRGLNAATTWTRSIEGVLSGTGKSVAAIANTGNTITDITKDNLDGVTSREELEELVVNIQDKYIERGTNFLMSGITGNITVTANSETPVTVSLKRVDAKFRFNITTAANVTFTPSDWRVMRVPRKTGLLNTHEDLCLLPEECFDSGWAKFEDDGKTFAFYSMENVVTPRAMIPSQGTFAERYALREKQDKTPVGEGINVTNGAFTYAPATGTYIEMRGNVSYSDGVEISADVVYTIHLGGVDQNVDDYNSLRNTYYTYHVEIVSVNKIVVEVESSLTGQENEQRPGAEGDVTAALYIEELDAYNGILSMTFGESNVDETLTWNVNTPFSDGAEIENPADFRWIRFRINGKTGNMYNESFPAYAGDSQVYTGGVELDTYMHDVANGKDKMLFVDQLVSILKASKERYDAGGNHLFDTSRQIRFTAFVDEYYYDTNPNDPSETAENGLWKKFVNQKERVMNILSNVTYSPDHESSKSNAVYSIRQASIQTMYNCQSAANFTAWGTQMIQDENPIVFERTVTRGDSADYNDTNNGRKNSIQMWLDDSHEWSNYITQNDWMMQSDYEAAKYKCLRMNRDNNGNGVIDENEIQWYLAAINQLTDIWIGEWSYDPAARLYKKTTWSLQEEQYFASSTVTDKKWSLPWGYKDNPQILWSAEGSSVGILSANEQTENINVKVYYRCVRNLGIARNAGSDTKPSELATYDAATHRISLQYLDAQSIRGYFQTDELPEHHEREAANKPYWTFEVMSRGSGGNYYTWNSLRTAIAEGNSPCPEGYRVPNQRELALMFSRIGNDGNWTLSNHFSRTRFQFTNSRPGFSVSQNNDVLYLTHANAGGDFQSGGVRCVKDVRK